MVGLPWAHTSGIVQDRRWSPMARAFSRCRGVLNLTAFLQAYCLHGSANGYALCENTSYRGRGESGVVTGLDRLVP